MSSVIINHQTKTQHAISKAIILIAIAIMGITAMSCGKQSEKRGAALIDADSTMEQAYTLYDNGDFEQSLNLAKVALATYERYNEPTDESDCYAHLSCCYMRLGDFESGINYAINGMTIDERLNDKERLSSTYNNLAALYLSADRAKEGLPLIKKAITMEQSLDNPSKLSIRYGIAAEIELKLNHPDNALSYINQALDLDIAANDTIKIGRRQSVMGDIYSQMGRNDDARMMYLSAIKLLSGKGEVSSLMITHQHLANLYKKLGRKSEALQHYETSFAIATQTNSRLKIQQISESLALLLKDENPSKAITYMQQSMALKDSIESQTVQDLTSKYAAQFQTKEKELTIAKQNHSLQRHRFILVVVAIVFAVLLLGCAALYYIIRLRARSQRERRELNLQRQEFFSDVTRQLRSPLAIIMGKVQSLRENESSTTRAAQLDEICRQSDAMKQIIDQLIDVSQATNQHNTWYHGNVVALAKMTLDSAQPVAKERQITMDFVAESNVIEMDFVPYLLSSIISDVVIKSLKLADNGGRIVSTLREQEKNIVFTSLVMGCHISNDDARTMMRSQIKHFIDAMNGVIEIISVKDKGTLFTVTLPATHTTGGFPKWVPDNVISDTPITIHNDNSTNDKEITTTDIEQNDLPLVLIANDNTDMLRHIDSIVSRYYRTILATDGMVALELAQRFQPDIIITDNEMPRMTGLELCQELKNSNSLKAIPIILISSMQDSNERIDALNHGADALMPLPFNNRELLALIKRMITHHEVLKNKYMNTLAETNGQEPANGNDREFLNNLNNQIMANIADPELSSNMLADKLFLSQRQLNRKVKAITGFDTANYIREMRISLAKRLLTSTDEPVSEIVVKCGFDSASYFAKIFKQIAGLTPTEYRKAHQNA